MSICDVINSFIEAARQRARESGGFSGGIILVKCFSCCCQNLVNAIMQVSRRAYIFCAVHGTDFHKSGKNSFNLIMRNIVKVVVTTQVRNIQTTII